MKKLEKFDKIINFRLALFVALSLVVGIVTAYFFIFKNYLVASILCLVFALCIAAYFLPYKKQGTIRSKIIFSLIFVIVFAIGGALFNFVVSDYKKADLDGHTYTVTARVADISKTDVGCRLLLDSAKIKGNRTGNLKYKIHAYVYGDSQLKVGDKIEFSTSLVDKGLIYEGKFNAYDLLNKIKYTTELSAENYLVISGGHLTVFERVSEFLKNTLQNGLDEDEFSVAYALLTGRDEFMDYSLLNNFRSAGVAHIFAVSGLHIGFIAMALGFMFDKFKVNRLAKAIMITAALFFYSGVCGFTASSVRAAIMCAVSLFLAVKGKRYDGISSVSLSAVIVLLISPVQLFHVGFQLSFCVVIGMILLSKPIAKAFKFLPQKLANALGAVIAAQIAGIPVCLVAFGQFSTIAIVANLIFIPCVSVIFIGLLVCTMVGGAFGIAKIALFIPNYVLKFVNMCISAFDYQIFMVGGIVLGGFALVYAVIFLISSELINLKKKVKGIVCAILAIIFAFGCTTLTIKEANAITAYVIGSKNVCATVITSSNENLMVVSSVNYIYSVGRLKRLSEREGVKHIDTVIILGGLSVDEQVFLTKLRTVFTLEKVYYYGDRKPQMEQIVEQSFKEIDLCVANSGQTIVPFADLKYDLNGEAVTFNLRGKRCAILANTNANSYAGLDGEYHFMVCGGQAETVLNYYRVEVGVGYRAHSYVNDGEKQGTFIYQFN